MDNSKEREQAIGDIQITEQHLHNLMAQKQMSLVELQEIENAIKELKVTKGEVYKILSGVMIKSSQDILLKELEEKKKVAELRINSIEKQEGILEERASKLRNKIFNSVNKEAKI